MSKKIKGGAPDDHEYSALFSVGASTSVRFKAPAGTSYKKLEQAAEMGVENPTVCHQCADNIEIGDIDELCEILDITDGVVLEPEVDNAEFDLTSLTVLTLGRMTLEKVAEVWPQVPDHIKISFRRAYLDKILGV